MNVRTDAEGLEARVAQHLEHLKVTHYAPETLKRRASSLRIFVAWCAERGITRPTEVTRAILERYQKHLYYHQRDDGRPLMVMTQRSYLAILRVFFKWMARANHMLYNPASELELPLIPRQLPKHVLSEEEVERVMNQPDIAIPMGVRDRAILETLYSTGIRRKELAGLKLYDLDAEKGTLMVRFGKGGRQRTVPIGARAIDWIEKYVREVRPGWVVPPEEGVMFLNRYGRPTDEKRISELVAGYVKAAGIGKEGGAHLLRHAMATAMLEHGADIRYIQEILGHAKLETTQIYTRVSIKKLKEVHAATHPAEVGRTRPRELPEELREVLADEDDGDEGEGEEE